MKAYFFPFHKLFLNPNDSSLLFYSSSKICQISIYFDKHDWEYFTKINKVHFKLSCLILKLVAC